MHPLWKCESLFGSTPIYSILNTSSTPTMGLVVRQPQVGDCINIMSGIYWSPCKSIIPDITRPNYGKNQLLDILYWVPMLLYRMGYSEWLIINFHHSQDYSLEIKGNFKHWYFAEVIFLILIVLHIENIFLIVGSNNRDSFLPSSFEFLMNIWLLLWLMRLYNSSLNCMKNGKDWCWLS